MRLWNCQCNWLTISIVIILQLNTARICHSSVTYGDEQCAVQSASQALHTAAQKLVISQHRVRRSLPALWASRLLGHGQRGVQLTATRTERTDCTFQDDRHPPLKSQTVFFMRITQCLE